jgi:hypothetical protein
MRFPAEELAVTMGAKQCHGETCDSGDTCTNITNSTQKPRPMPKPGSAPGTKKSQLVSVSDLDTLLAQLRAPSAG